MTRQEHIKQQTETLSAKRQADKHRRDKRRENKQCLDCGSEDLATNNDGTKSVKCVRCRANATISQKTKFSAAKMTAQPRTARDWYDIEELKGWLDTPRFKAYTILVRRAIERIIRRGDKATIGAQIAELGDNYIERMHMDALDNLKGEGCVEEIQLGARRGYILKDIPAPKVYGYDKSPACKSSKTEPWNLLTDNKRRVLA